MSRGCEAGVSRGCHVGGVSHAGVTWVLCVSRGSHAGVTRTESPIRPRDLHIRARAHREPVDPSVTERADFLRRRHPPLRQCVGGAYKT
eukprot:4678883-Prymnesium_polylepis.1